MDCEFLAAAGARSICLHPAQHRHAPGLAQHEVDVDICAGCLIRDWPATKRPAPSAAEAAATVRTLPPLDRQLRSAAGAALAFVGSLGALVDEPTLLARVAACEACDRFLGGRCAECGCRTRLKARGRVFECPLGKWPT